jgi:long-chain fatty acid transport protein
VAATCAALILAEGTARADAPDTYGVGSRNAALGSSVSASAYDWTSAYYNPAGLAQHRRLQAGIGMQAAQERLQPFEDVVLGYDQDGTPIRGEVGADYDDVYGITAGISRPLSKRLYFGAVIWSPLQRLVRIMTVDPYVPHYVFYVNRAQRITLNFALAYRITPWLRAGAGASALAGSHFDLDLNIPAGEGSDENESRALIALDITPTLTPVAGLQLDAGESWSFGATYRGETELTTTVRQKTGSNTVITVGPSLRFTSRVRIDGGFVILDHFTPQQVAAGGSWDAKSSRVAVSADVTWMDWSAYRGPYVDPDFDDILIPPLGTVGVNWRNPPDVQFRDTYVPRVGAELRVADRVAIRGGYSYEMSPAPLPDGSANILDANAHVASAGLGWRFGDPSGYVKKPVTLNVHARIRALQAVTAQKITTYDCDDPDAHPPVGYPCAGEVTTAGSVISGGFDLSFDF